jgi:membrane dipeptidase
MLVFDLHLDLAMNALLWNRDLTLPLDACRGAECGLEGKGRGKNTVTLPEMRRGRVGLCIATVLARVHRGAGFGTGYRTHEIAYAVAQGMLAYYRQCERMGICRLVRTGDELKATAQVWEAIPPPAPAMGSAPAQAEGGGEMLAAAAPAGGAREGPPFGFVLGTEGADCIVSPSQLPLWWEDGLRVVSLVHYGVSKYAHGTGTDGPLTPDGRDLLAAMDEIGAILDITHQSDASFWESLEHFRGPVIASHQNCRALVPGGRQMSDDQLRALLARGALIGPALDNWMLYPHYVRGHTPNVLVSLNDYVNHIDHICQLAGHARQVAIGSDLDGGYGYEQTPCDLNSIADLQKVPALLKARGYSDEDVAGIMGGNAVRFFARALP